MGGQVGMVAQHLLLDIAARAVPAFVRTREYGREGAVFQTACQFGGLFGVIQFGFVATAPIKVNLPLRLLFD